MTASLPPAERSSRRLNDFTMMLVIHDAFRRDVRRIGDALRTAPHGLPAGRTGALLERWQWISEQLHHHHSGEDRWLWPALREQLRANAAGNTLLDEMEAEHEHLEPALRDFDLALRALVDHPEPERIAVARQAWTTFSTVFEAHLSHEERDAVPLLEQRLPPAALRRFERAQQRTMGFRVAMTQFFPWLLDEAPASRQDHVLAMLPAPLRWAVQKSRKGYERRTVPAWT